MRRFIPVGVLALLLAGALWRPRLGIPTVQAQDGTGLDKITWSGTIRVDFGMHSNQNTTDGGSTHTLTRNETRVTEYQVENLPHSGGAQWSSERVRAQVRGSEETASLGGNRNYTDTGSGGGSSTGVVALWIRGDGANDWGHCRIQISNNGTDPIRYPGTVHSWGVEVHPYNITNTTMRVLLPESVNNMDFPCAIGARSLTGTQETEHSDDIIQRVTWDLHQSGDPQTEVELIPPGEYAQWLPQADENEKTIGNFIDVEIVAHTKGDPTLQPPQRVLKYTVTLQDTSKQKGVDLNWPSPDRGSGPTTDYDFRIDETNPWIKLTDPQGQAAETKQEGLTDFWVTLNSYDWGGWTQLKVVAELSDHSTVTAHVRGAPQQTLAVPKDDDGDHVADAWEDMWGVPAGDGAADDDDVPVGNGKGDSVALYDEYRGFHIKGRHERLSPKTKDLFVLDYDKLGSGYYEQSTGVRVHLVTTGETSIDAEGLNAGGNASYVTPNGEHGKTYAVSLHNASIGGGVVGDTPGGPAPPPKIELVMIDTVEIAAAYKDDQPWAARIATITHELGHATNVFHHGQKADYEVGAVVCRRPDGTERTLACDKPGGCYEVAGKGGQYSGNDTCPMRYDMTEFFEDPGGACHLVSGGGKRLSVYGADPPGLWMFCANPMGTGVNDPDDPHNKAGNATVGKCATQIRLK